MRNASPITIHSSFRLLLIILVYYCAKLLPSQTTERSFVESNFFGMKKSSMFFTLSNRPASLVLVLVAFLHWFCFAAQAAVVTTISYDPSPASFTGYITDATLDSTTDVLSGGTITVNGVKIIIPKNLLVNTPSLTALAWSELFVSGKINLPLWPTVSWEASITANYIGGRHIAGIVYIYQETFNANQGFITHIDYTTGELRINGAFGTGTASATTGLRIQINDPVGRYGKVHGSWPIWTADTDNPSVSASTGFPVCIPRSDPTAADDPLCPKKNRPLDSSTGKPLSVFTFAGPPYTATTPDPNFFAPLLVGDHINFAGIMVTTGTDPLMAVYSIDANLGFYTKAGTSPSYLKVEALQAGINGNANGEIAETRVEGYTTDETATIQIYAIDVDPCTGDETERQWGSAVPRGTGRQGQWRWRSSDPALSPYTREVVVRMSTGTVDTKNNITAGQFVSPFPPDTFLFPELIVFGTPDIPNEFELLPWLALGSGPWLGGIPGVAQKATGPIVGQLDPWPGVVKPTPKTCPTATPKIPVADAGPDLVVHSGELVTLNGRTTTVFTPATSITYLWNQVTTGALLTLSNPNAAVTTFIAPTVTAAKTYVFRLTTSNANGKTTDTVNVLVTPKPNEVLSAVSASWKSGKGSGILTVLATTNVVDGSAQLFFNGTNPAVGTTSMTLVSTAAAGKWQGAVSMKPGSASVTVFTNLGTAVTVLST